MLTYLSVWGRSSNVVGVAGKNQSLDLELHHAITLNPESITTHLKTDDKFTGKTIFLLLLGLETITVCLHVYKIKKASSGFSHDFQRNSLRVW